MSTKQQLRQLIRQRRKSVSSSDSEKILSLLRSHPRIVSAQAILLYHALPDEVPTKDLLDELVAQHKSVLLPRVVSDTEMELRQYTSPADLTTGAFGIMEPVGEVYDSFSAIDVVVVPGMAFDRSGHRLGRGRGYYDRFLSRIPTIYKIGVCFPWQIVDEVPTDSHDVLMDEVIG